jgi:chromosome segregation ATPase
MEWQTGLYGGLAALLVGLVGKSVVPMLMRMLDNGLASANASGGLLATVIQERDQWKAKAEQIDAALQDMRKEWAEMKSDMGTLRYQLQEARETIASLTGKPLPSKESAGA